MTKDCNRKPGTRSYRLSEPLEAFESCALESQPAHVALHEIPELVIRNAQFQPVAAFKLECHIVRRTGTVMVHIPAMVVMRYTCPFGHYPGVYRKYGGVVVPVPFRNTPDRCQSNEDKDYYKRKAEKYRKNAKKRVVHVLITNCPSDRICKQSSFIISYFDFCLFVCCFQCKYDLSPRQWVQTDRGPGTRSVHTGFCNQRLIDLFLPP